MTRKPQKNKRQFQVSFLTRYASIVVLAIVLPPMVISCSGGKPDQGNKDESDKTRTDNSDAARRTKVIAEYSELIVQNPTAANDRGELAYHSRGRAYAEKGEHDKAIADFTEAIRLYPLVKNTYPDARLMGVHDARANSHQKRGEYDKAIIDYTEVIKLGTKGQKDIGNMLFASGMAADAYYKRGVCHDDKGEHDKALADYKKAVEIAPDLKNNEDLKKRMSK